MKTNDSDPFQRGNLGVFFLSLVPHDLIRAGPLTKHTVNLPHRNEKTSANSTLWVTLSSSAKQWANEEKVCGFFLPCQQRVIFAKISTDGVNRSYGPCSTLPDVKAHPMQRLGHVILQHVPSLRVLKQMVN